MLKPNSKLVYDYVKANGANDITANDIAEGTGLPAKHEIQSAHQSETREGCRQGLRLRGGTLRRDP